MTKTTRNLFLLVLALVTMQWAMPAQAQSKSVTYSNLAGVWQTDEQQMEYGTSAANVTFLASGKGTMKYVGAFDLEGASYKFIVYVPLSYKITGDNVISYKSGIAKSKLESSQRIPTQIRNYFAPYIKAIKEMITNKSSYLQVQRLTDDYLVMENMVYKRIGDAPADTPASNGKSRRR